MSDQSNSGAEPSFATSGSLHKPKRDLKRESKTGRRHAVVLRVSSVSVAGILSVLMITAVAPPIVADQSDRAVVNAPITLLTAPISGEIDQFSALPMSDVNAGDRLAQVLNERVDRGTLISLEERSSAAREKLEATRAKKESDRAYIVSLDAEIANQARQTSAQFESQIEELRARVAKSNAQGGEKKALVDRQNTLVARDAASMDMVKPTSQQYSAALHNTAAENAKLDQKIAQLAALREGIYVGDDLAVINAMTQKRRDIDLDARRMDIEERELSAVVADLQDLIDTERRRLDSLAAADVRSAGQGKLLTVGAAMGRHVNAGDTIASVVDCNKLFAVAIFSYRQGQNMKVGARVKIDGSSFRTGVVTAVLPKTNDKADERFAVPFPQTERRELYVVITPDPDSQATAAADLAQDSACSVGQWVTVTRDNGIVPSMSVTWHRVGTLLASWMPDDTAHADHTATPAPNPELQRAGTAPQEAAHARSQQPQDAKPDEDWLSRARWFMQR